MAPRIFRENVLARATDVSASLAAIAMHALRIAVRVAAVLLLLIAAILLAVKTGEYPGMTPPALRFMATEVLPLIAVAALNLAALDVDVPAAGWRRVIAIASSAVLLAASLPEFQRGAPPVSIALPIIAAVLLTASAAIEMIRRRKRR